MIIKKLLEDKILFLLLIGLTCGLTWASLAKIANPIQVDFDGGDKIAHFIAYFVFAIGWFLPLFFSKKWNKSLNTSMFITAAICISYGVLMEILQLVLTAYRSFDWYDAVANTCGTIFALLIFSVFRSKVIKLKETIGKSVG
ncbi:VanZ family protein [Aquimarina pacifica]|uniref:VanZ family protein n=1 Tax=Aquimarina pacifica TaxID=1296415 RepID=UPI00046F072F|nr:VanZ family protein [Aquimarina pacifica]